jgi:hypothetical protein
MKSNIWFLPEKPSAKRILMHAINHVGLGHLSRSIAMAQRLQAGIPDVQILLLIEGGEYLIEPTGLPWIRDWAWEARTKSSWPRSGEGDGI